MRELDLLNSETATGRLSALRAVIDGEKTPPAALPQYANNHIHTFYSFSPYSPAAAVYYARAAGLQTAGIMDHDTIAGAYEFIEAGAIAGVATTIGLECRVGLEGTEFEKIRVNNPDQRGCAYMALHGVPHTQISRLQEVFAPLREKRNARNRKMAANINTLMKPFGITLDFDKEVLPISKYAAGGCVTERHLLYALGEKIAAATGRQNTAAFLEDELRLPLSPKQKQVLTDGGNPFFAYDLLGVLKAGLVERVYVPATDECMHISQLAALAAETGSLFCYPYLGDVTDSVTGDKKAQKFEDDFLDELFDFLQSQGIKAVTYMPSRNTPAQLERVQKLCRGRGIMEISGEDINSPRQKFICGQLASPQFAHLIKATWDLIDREKRETERQLNAVN